MRVEQRREDVLHHHQEPDPVGKPLAAKQQQMQDPDRVENGDADDAPLHCDVQRLVMRIADHFGGRLVMTTGRRDPLEQSARRARAVAHDRRLREEAERFPPEFQPQSHRSRLAPFHIAPVVPGKPLRGLPQMRRGLPGKNGSGEQGGGDDRNAAPSQVKQREHAEHDRNGNERRARHHHEDHVDEEAERERREQGGEPVPLLAQQHHDRIGERDRAECELLALVDVVLDEDAALGRIGLERKIGIEGDQPRHHRQQRAGHQKGDEHPVPARRALEMIEQDRQHEQLDGRIDRIEARAPGRIRPQRPDQRENDQRDRRRTDRTLQRLQEGAEVEERHHAEQHQRVEDPRKRRRPGQRGRGQDRKQVDRLAPGRRTAQAPPQHLAGGLPGKCRRLACHLPPPRAR